MSNQYLYSQAEYFARLIWELFKICKFVNILSLLLLTVSAAYQPFLKLTREEQTSYWLQNVVQKIWWAYQCCLHINEFFFTRRVNKSREGKSPFSHVTMFRDKKSEERRLK